MRNIHTNTTIGLVVATLVQAAAHAQAPQAGGSEGVFTLGQISVVEELEQDSVSDDTVSGEEVWQFNTNTLTEAVKLVPGVSSVFVSNGRRNEGDISVRGFDRWRVPLSIDGIRVYLPADNRLDFNRFLTADLAEVQIRKSYVSVLDGPGAMGGAINLVTRKPTKAFEADFQTGASFGEDASYDGWFGSAVVGTKQDNWYLQGSATQIKRESWSLSRDFVPEGPAEDGGERDGSQTLDWRVNLKAGFTPNETDEYSLSFTKQNGEKAAPLGVDFLRPDGTVRNPPYQPNNYWTWPFWDIQSVYWLSHTQFSDTAYLKTRAFYNEFDNLLSAWDDNTYSSQSNNGRFNSYYGDTSVGGSVEAGAQLFGAGAGTTRAAFHWRRDRHSEYNHNRPSHPTMSSIEPKQRNEEQTWSLALEHSWSFSEAVEAVAGISYDENDLKLAQEFNNTDGLYEYPIGGSDAFNWQAGLAWHYADNAQFGASVSSRTRFPNNFERFSTRFGNAVPNPDLATERAVHYELSWKATPVDSTRLTAAVFYVDVQDMIQTVIVQAAPQLTQTQNVGDGRYYGLELSADWELSSQLRVGANYSYLSRKITDALQPGLQAVGTPNHLGFAYLAWLPMETLTIQPSLEFAGKRWTDNNGSAGLGYERIGEYTLANLQVSWRMLENVEGVIGGRNLLDRNFRLANGFPEPGRSLFAKLRVTL